MVPEGWEAVLRPFLSSWTGDNAAADTPGIVFGTTAFLVRSFDGNALHFSFPLLIRRDLQSVIGPGPAGSDGGVSSLIGRIRERAKERAGTRPAVWERYSGLPARRCGFSCVGQAKT